MRDYMRQLIIGVDADGVLNNMSKFHIKYGTKFFKREPVQPEAYSVREMFACSPFMEVLYGLFYFKKYCKEYEPREEASSVIQELNQEGHELHEITARKFVTLRNFLGKYSRNMFKTWTEKYNMDFKSYQYCSEKWSPRDKWIACHKLSVDVMIDDKPDVALYLANHGIKVLLFDAPYNQDVKHENITRVFNWVEVHDQIQDLRVQMQEEEEKDFQILDGKERQKLTPYELRNYLRNYKKYLKQQPYNVETNKQFDRNFKLFRTLGMLPMIFTKIKVEGKENIPYQDGLIFASNHLDSYDQFFISKALGNRPLRGLAATTIKDTFRGKLFQKSGVTFVDRTDAEDKKMAEEKLCIDLVNDNNILIFPEGTRKNKTEEGKQKKILQFQLGTASIAQKTGSPIVPIAIVKKNNFVSIRFDNPIVVGYENDIETATNMLQENIVTLIDKPQELVKKRSPYSKKNQ